MNVNKLMKAALAFTVMVCALVLPAQAALPRPDPAVAEFARGVKFTVAGYTGTEVLTNFPVLVRLKEYNSGTGEGIQGFLYSDFNYTDGDDLCFVDMQTNGIPYEIDTWNRSGESLVWVTLPRVTNGTEFVMWYHSVNSGKLVSTGDPWADYTGVWHMELDSNKNLKDSTTNELTAVATSGAKARTSGRIGASCTPTETGTSKDAQCIEVSLSQTAKKNAVDNLNTTVNGNAFSVAFWVKPERYSTGQSNPQSAYLVGRKVADGDGSWAIQYHYDSVSHYNKFRLWTSETKDTDVKVVTVDTAVIPDSVSANGNWYKLYVVYNGKTVTLYVNGNAYSESVTANNYAANGNKNLFLAGTSGTGTRDFRGEMDEVRLRTGASSADWVKADYNTVTNAAFLSAGSVESVVIVEKPVFGVTLDDFGASHAQFTATVSSLGASTASSCTLKAKVWPTSGQEPAAWTEYASNLGQDVPATFKVKGLSTATPYSYKIIVVNNEGVEANETPGTFTTAGVGVAGMGGDVTRVGDDWIHYFRIDIDDESGDTVDTYTFAPPSYASTVKALVVAGGGPGGYQAGGGGGAGGYIYDAALAVSSASTYTVNVGAGGVASTSHDAYGSNGGDSSIVGGGVNVVAVGGGAGGNGNTCRAGVAGGSGGGSSLKAEAVGAGTSGQGHAGGLGNEQTTLANRLAGGGGGAGAAGGDATLVGATHNPGGGGKGAECDITGVATWYAGGGGGGGGYYSGKQDAAADGGLGGGGAGSRKSASGSVELAGDGVDGLGGGGGGGSGDQSGFEKGGDGGDGIVIIRYASQGDPSTITEPIVTLQTAVCNDTTFEGDVAFRVAWAGYGCETADVKAVWGYAADSLNRTNDLATGMIGLGSGAFPLKSDKRTVYVRLLTVNGNGVSALSSETLSFYVNENENSEEEVLPSASDVGMSHIDSAYATVTGLVVSAGASHSLPSNCTVRVLWGTSPSSLNHSAEGTFEVGAFSLNLEGLAPETTYYYDVELIDDEGNAIVAVAGESFTTLFPLVNLTLPSPLPANVTLVSVTTNGVAVTGNAGVYTVFSNATVVAAFAAAPGHRLVGDATVTVTLDGDTEISVASIPNAEQNPDVVAPSVSPIAAKVSPRKTATLTASATGATSYRWLKNGEPIEGGTSGTLTVNWRRPRNNPTDTYQAVAVYIIDGSTEESAASAEMTVENLPMGTVIMIRGASAPVPLHDYSADYLTFRIHTAGTICWKAFGDTPLTKTIEYSINNGEWTSITSTSGGATITVEQGDLVRFRGNNTTYATSTSKYSGFEGGTATYDIEGNIMSLLYGDNFAGNTILPDVDYIFCALFKKAPVVSAENLVLPATALQTYCYRALFSYCTMLTNTPALPATTLAKGCYQYMFEKCALTEAPVLNAATLVNECYGYMFSGCGSLNQITCRATAGFGTSNCLTDWVKNVAGSGMFAKASNISWATGTSGIPSKWTVSEDILPLQPEVSFDGETIALDCYTEGAEIHYRLGQTGDFALYTAPISIAADTVIETYSTYQGHTSETFAATCVYAQETAFQRSNKDLPTWRYGGNTITTPYSVNASDGHSSSYATGSFAFDTSVTLLAAQPTYLWFQHADQCADIYVDNVKVGTHWGGYNAFFFDISERVHAGQNKIRVTLYNNKGGNLAPAAGDFNFNATLGNVKLFTSPVLPAMKYGYDGFHITSTVSDSSATINVKTTVPSGAELVCTITNNDGYVWTETKQSNGEEQTFTTTISGSHLHLWNGKAAPYLYNVKLEIYKDNELYHRYERPYGFRYYEYVINQTINGQPYTGFLLNGKPYQLRGVCMHDDVEGKANALTDSDYDQEFAIIRELGCNFIRLAHYPHPKEVYDRCDQLGIIVQTEVPCVNKLQSTMSEAYYTHLTTQYIDMVQQHYNHPCIMFWGLSNETVKDDAEFGKVKINGYYDLITDLDSERLVGYVMSHSVDDPSGYYNDPKVDWFGCNIYVGWYIDKSSNDPSPRLNTRLANTLARVSKPLAFSEYGCGGTPHCHSENFKKTTTTGNNPRHDIEYQMWLHEGHLAAIRSYTNLLFTGQWQLFDIAVSSRKEGFTECIDGVTVTTNAALRYLNNKGLVERDHVTKKDTFYLYKAEWNPDPFVHICGKDYTKTTDRKLKCYTNDGNSLSLYVGNNLIETVDVVDHIAEFTARGFSSGDEIRVEGAQTSDTMTFQ